MLILIICVINLFVTADYAYGFDCKLEIDIEKNCSKQYTQNYHYHNFFPIEKSTKKDNALASVAFYVKADHDAHILLSPTNNQTDKDPVYEIVLGGAGNTAAEIRKGHKAKGEKAVLMKDAVSRNDWKAYWIRIIDDGTIMVGKKEDDLPFLHWKDPKPLTIKYYSFSSWDNTVALWAHQCSTPNQTSNSSQPEGRSIKSDVIEDGNLCENYTTQASFYTEFFPIEKSNTNEDLLANLTFYILAESNAHIVLSSTIEPSEKEPVYEIVLGAANNTMSEIRRMQKAKSKVSVKMTDALSKNEWKGYWIRIQQDGLIQVGKVHEDKAFVYWKDLYPLQVKYYSFSTWDDVPTTWKHKCSKTNSSDEQDLITGRFATASSKTNSSDEQDLITRRFATDTDEAHTCKSLHTTNHQYQQFFPIEKSNSTSDVVASIKFNVKTSRDAHIFLSGKPKPSVNEPGYEIVLGSGGNTASEIRRGQKTENKTRVPTPGVVSGNEWRSFWIRVKSDGMILVGKEGDDWPILYWQDPKPVTVKYYGFSSWMGVDATWEHQCPYGVDAQPLARIQKDPETPENCQDTFTFTYNYTQFFPILKSNLSGDNFVFLTFFVKADSNAHILLSQSTKPTEKEPVYEIVLGSANNVASEIRKGQKTENKEMKYMTNTVSHDEWREYWIRVEADGLVMVGNEGDDFPFMYWKDPEPLNVEYYSFSSWYDTTALWKHRCIQPDDKYLKSAAKTCKTFYTQGFNYFPLFGIEKSANKPNISFELTFDVKTDNTASVLLATTSKPSEKDTVYEIIFGSSNNTLSEIRRGQKAEGKTMAVVVMTDMSPSNEWKKYWIQILNDGSILVGKLGDNLNLPFLRWKDPKPLQIKYYGFSSTINSIALWQYQCSDQNQQQPKVDSHSNVRLQSSRRTRLGKI